MLCSHEVTWVDMSGIISSIAEIHNWSACNTVEQEIFATGNFRDFRPQAIRAQEIFANFLIEELLSFKISPCLSKSDQ